MALTCKRLHTLCTPFLEHYNNLRWHFQDFTYCKTNRAFKFNQQLFEFPDTASSAFNLISRIAIEPAVGRYIQEADFGGDSWLNTRFASATREMTTYQNRDEAVRRLFADSSYLLEAQLDWREYYGVIEEDLNAARYSQYAAAFALTLLPNLKKFSLPGSWKPTTATEKLVATVIQRARQASDKNMPSLAQVTTVKEMNKKFELGWAVSFIALPRVQSFWGLDCIGEGPRDEGIGSRYLHSDFNSTVEKVEFWDSCIDEVAISDFLKYTPCLKSLTYWHSPRNNEGRQDWDLCRFIMAVQHEVGNHLEKLSAIPVVWKPRCSITPGKPLLRGFQRLQSLELPLEIVICGLTATELAEHESSNFQSLLSDLVPASVSQLSLFSRGKHTHRRALDLLFRDFASRKYLQTPALKAIRLTCPDDADDSYKSQCTKLAAELDKANVALELTKEFTTIIGENDGEEWLVEEEP